MDYLSFTCMSFISLILFLSCLLHCFINNAYPFLLFLSLIHFPLYAFYIKHMHVQ